MKVNMGCGDRPTRGWVNIDNSPTVLLAKSPLRFLLPGRRDFIRKVRQHNIRYGNALRTRFAGGSVDVLYACHLLEHFDRDEAHWFLAEARRVLKPGGLLRIAVPDLRRQVDEYLKSGDADAFLAYMEMAVARPRGLGARIRAALIPFRHHRWMYDPASLRRLLEGAGFVGIADREAGETAIARPGALDLRERDDDSLYIECFNPA